MDLLPLIALTALAALGGAVGILLALRGGSPSSGTSAAAPGLLRLTAEVHTGWEQTLLGLHRELRLPRRPDDLPYGSFYLDPDTEHRLLLRSRSEIGRGFLGAAELVPARRSTLVRYSILRLPGDEQVRDRVLDLDLQLITALRRIDPAATVQLTGAALRELESRQPPTSGQEPA